MSKLHELLAVETDLRGQAEVCRNDLKATFEKKSHHFTKKVVTVKSTEENGQPDKVESQLNLQTTVMKELAWIGEMLAKALDAGHQIDLANTRATADIVLEDDSILLKGVPTTSLLRLEHRIVEIRDLLTAVGTLDPAKGFSEDPMEGEGIFKAQDREAPKTDKRFRFIVMVPPGEKHPAQVKELMEDVKVGVTLTQEWSSLLTVKAKGDMLARVEDVLRAVKKARARANDLDINVKENKIGSTILDYVFKGRLGSV